MHLLEEPDLGHYMIYYDGKLEKKRYLEEEEKSPAGFEPTALQPRDQKS